MSFLTSPTAKTIHSAFARHNIPIAFEPTRMLARREGFTDAGITKLISDCNYFPIVLPTLDAKYYSFTVSPYVDNFNDTPSVIAEKSYFAINGFIKEVSRKFPTEYQKHFNQNKSHILSLAKGLEGDALILGLGNGDDIPLQLLAEQFENVTVVDVDVESMQQAIERLPLHLQNKIKMVRLDLTGLVSFIENGIAQLDFSVKLEKNVEAINQILKGGIEQAKKQGIIDFGSFDFVVSSMLAGQLSSLITAYINFVLVNKYPNCQEDDLVEKNLSSVLNKLETILIENHLKSLRCWTKHSGRVYLADTFSISNVIGRNELVNGEQTLKLIPMDQGRRLMDMSKINDTISKLFCHVYPVQKWNWLSRPPQMSQGPSPKCLQFGNQSEVTAHFLRPK